MSTDIKIQVENVSKKYIIGSVARLNLSDEIAYHLRRLIGVNPDILSKVDRVIHEREFWALNDVSLTIRSGEAVGLIGANGAGKSTLLKILSRITPPTTGRVVVTGRVGTMLEVGTGFHPELTGRENIYLNGAILGMSRKEIDRKFDAIVDFSGVEKFLETPVKRYSSGMYVRLAFAVASNLDPDILIVDEVLAVGDAAFQRKCVERMKAIAAGSDTTVIFVSHSMANVRMLCNRCVWFENGRIIQDGPTQDICQMYEQKQLNKT
ncbi:MAG: ABC transporter ATP-binding protein [Lentisphaerae bacterium]|nr:ABC transporter ATP-binding protein [Lentisphaerota bacterium]